MDFVWWFACQWQTLLPPQSATINHYAQNPEYCKWNWWYIRHSTCIQMNANFPIEYIEHSSGSKSICIAFFYSLSLSLISIFLCVCFFIIISLTICNTYSIWIEGKSTVAFHSEWMNKRKPFIHCVSVHTMRRKKSHNDGTKQPTDQRTNEYEFCSNDSLM